MEKGDERPLADRIRSMVLAFEELGIKQVAIEKRLGHNVDATISTELVTLQKIYRSIKDGMAKPDDFFDMPRADFKAASDLQDKLDQTINPESWACYHCDFVAVSERGLKKHMTQQHPEPPVEDSQDETSTATEPISSTVEQSVDDLDPDMPVECYKCNRTVAFGDAIVHTGKDGVQRYWCGLVDCS